MTKKKLVKYLKGGGEDEYFDIESGGGPYTLVEGSSNPDPPTEADIVSTESSDSGSEDSKSKSSYFSSWSKSKPKTTDDTPSDSGSEDSKSISSYFSFGKSKPKKTDDTPSDSGSEDSKSKSSYFSWGKSKKTDDKPSDSGSEDSKSKSSYFSWGRKKSTSNSTIISSVNKTQDNGITILKKTDKNKDIIVYDKDCKSLEVIHSVNDLDQTESLSGNELNSDNQSGGYNSLSDISNFFDSDDSDDSDDNEFTYFIDDEL